ncbi:MAG: AmmeMemoRadiSam system protein B [Candidatus Woesearchaeota archaeon]
MYFAKYANQFYPENGLQEYIEKIHKSITTSPKKENAIIGIAPHAGYFFSLETALKTHTILFDNAQIGTTVIIFSPSHTGLGNAISTQNYSTPLGVIENNSELLKYLVENQIINEDYFNDEAINYEHAVEVHIPIIQYLSKLHKTQLKYLAFVFDNPSRKNLEIVKFLLENSYNNEKLKIIISSDFIHFGYSYDFIPFTNNIDENFYKLNREIIEHIININPEGFWKNSHTVCGKVPIYLTLKAIKELDLNLSPTLIELTDSSKKMKHFDRVAYCSLIFSK